MKIGIFGTGPVGQTLAAALAGKGHDVFIGTRDPEATLKRVDKDNFGNPPFKDWKAAHGGIGFGSFADAARHGEILINATNGNGALAAIEAAGADAVGDKVVIDVSNPLDFSRGMPPRLSVSNDDSLGEQIQRALPRARVVKTLNTVNAWLMVDPKRLAGGDHTMFMAGNDASAKAQSRMLLESFGWTDIVDLGDISNARATEMYLPLWARLWMATQNPMFSIKLVR